MLISSDRTRFAAAPGGLITPAVKTEIAERYVSRLTPPAAAPGMAPFSSSDDARQGAGS